MKLGNKESGQGMVEYALLLVLIAVVVIAALQLIAPKLNLSFQKIINALTGISTVTYQYQITNLNVIRDNACDYKLMIRVTTTDSNGDAAPNTDVPIMVSLSSPSASKTFTPKTDAAGVAKVQDEIIYSHVGACQHGTATIDVGNGELTTTLGY